MMSMTINKIMIIKIWKMMMVMMMMIIITTKVKKKQIKKKKVTMVIRIRIYKIEAPWVIDLDLLKHFYGQ